MNENLLKLALKCAHREWSISTKKIPNVKVVYQVETETDVVYFWNSSNNGTIDIPKVLLEISSYIAEGLNGGSVSDDFKEVMFEVEEK